MPRVLAQDGRASGERRGKMKDRWSIEAVLLDMDGTLLDTEKVYCESLYCWMRCRRLDVRWQSSPPRHGGPPIGI